jgi:hypothetical protein
MEACQTDYIYRIEIDGYKKYVEDLGFDYYTHNVYEARLLRKAVDDPNDTWEVIKVFYSNSTESVFIESNHYKKKLTGEWK